MNQQQINYQTAKAAYDAICDKANRETEAWIAANGMDEHDPEQLTVIVNHLVELENQYGAVEARATLKEAELALIDWSFSKIKRMASRKMWADIQALRGNLETSELLRSKLVKDAMLLPA